MKTKGLRPPKWPRGAFNAQPVRPASSTSARIFSSPASVLIIRIVIYDRGGEAIRLQGRISVKTFEKMRMCVTSIKSEQSGISQPQLFGLT